MMGIRSWQPLNAIFAVTLVAATMVGCSEATESKLVGTWEWKSCDDAGDVSYRKDHTFISREWALTQTQQPSIVYDSGDWHLHSGQLTLNFSGQSRPPEARHLVVSFIFFGQDLLVIRNSSGLIRTFQRVEANLLKRKQ
jgi:hypothetical protein